MSTCPWRSGSTRVRFYRPDWSASPDCPGCKDCTGQGHQCHLFGLPGMCVWPVPIVQDNYDAAWWRPARDASLAEKWLEAAMLEAVRAGIRDENNGGEA